MEDTKDIFSNNNNDEFNNTILNSASIIEQNKNEIKNNKKKTKNLKNKPKKQQNKETNKQLLEDMFIYTKTEEKNIKKNGKYDCFIEDEKRNLSVKELEEINNKFAKPKNKSQETYISMMNDKIKRVIIATGPAGTGKTLLATEYAIKQFMLGEITKIIFTRPSVSVDEDLGFLPGTLEDKMSPWMRPLYDILYTYYSVNDISYFIGEKIIEICPLGFMRGRTFKNCCIICDEMQNSTQAQMKMLLTRIGENSRLIITGDLDQCDINNINFNNGLDDFLNRLKKKRSDSISSVEFNKEDIEREEVVKDILEIYAF